MPRTIMRGIRAGRGNSQNAHCTGSIETGPVRASADVFKRMKECSPPIAPQKFTTGAFCAVLMRCTMNCTGTVRECRFKGGNFALAGPIAGFSSWHAACENKEAIASDGIDDFFP